MSSSGGKLGVTIAAGLTNKVLHSASRVLNLALFLPSLTVQIVFWGISGVDRADSALVERSWSFISAVRLSETAFVVWSMVCVHLIYTPILAVRAVYCKAIYYSVAKITLQGVAYGGGGKGFGLSLYSVDAALWIGLVQAPI